MTKKKFAIAFAAASLAATCAIGGTLAWLTSSAKVTNTFTVGHITASIAETPDREYKIIPGATIQKDPTITIEEGSEKCYVFAYIDNELKIGDVPVATFNINKDTWKKVSGKDGLYVYTDGTDAVEVDAASGDQVLPFFTTVTIDGDAVGPDNIVTLNNKTVTVYVYAHQSENTDYSAAEKAAREFDFDNVVE